MTAESMSEQEIGQKLDRLSEQLENGVKEGVDRLVGARKVDQWSKWVLSIAASVVTAGVIAIVGIVWSLTISNTELQGSINRLNDGLDAARQLNDSSLLSVIQRLAANEDRDDRQDTHMETIDNLLGATRDRVLDLERDRARVRPR